MHTWQFGSWFFGQVLLCHARGPDQLAGCMCCRPDIELIRWGVSTNQVMAPFKTAARLTTRCKSRSHVGGHDGGSGLLQALDFRVVHCEIGDVRAVSITASTFVAFACVPTPVWMQGAGWPDWGQSPSWWEGPSFSRSAARRCRGWWQSVCM